VLDKLKHWLAGDGLQVRRSKNCDLRLEDAPWTQEQAVIIEASGPFGIEARQSPVKVEDQVVTAPHPLHDGDTVEVGESRFVWTCVVG